MAVLTIPDEKRTLREFTEIQDHLASIGIQYERWEAAEPVSIDASAEQILAAYSKQIEVLKSQGGYVTADVIDVNPSTPNLDSMLTKFRSEHWHDEDEVRFIVKGHGLFHIAPPEGDVVSIEMEAGDLIRVPRGTLHWFDLCGDRTVRAIRLFQDTAGWTPHYTGSGVDARYEPVCFGPAYLPPNS